MNEPDNRVIAPADFSRAGAPARRLFFRPSPARIGLLAVFLALAAAALFMFNARAVLFSFDPEDASMEIGMPSWRFGERYLLLQREYELVARREGYYPLTVSVKVSSAPDQDYHYTLDKLPGRVAVTTADDKGEVTGAEVHIDQERKGVTPLIIDAVPAGSRDLYVRHPRYQPFQSEISVQGMGQSQEEQIRLTPAWAKVDIRSLPAGATVMIDAEPLGETPGSFEIIEGRRALQLSLPGYKTFESALDVLAGQDQSLDEILLLRSDGKINVLSHPPGASITVAGEYKGRTPLSFALPPGKSYQLTATSAGYETLKRPLNVKPDQDQSLNLQLKPLIGRVRLSVTPPGGALFVNGKARGDPNQTLELTAKAHDLRIELPGHATWRTQVIPQPGLPQQLNITLLTEEAARVSTIPRQITTSLGDTLRFIIPEKLQMGAGRREPGRRSNEIQKDVTLTRSYYLGEKEISNKSFKAFDPGHDSGLLGRALLSDPDRPVVNVSWEQAIKFCNWLSQQEGLPPAYEQRDGRWRLQAPATTGYRLPTEAEWAWAARYAGGALTRFPWGNSMPPPPGAGNFADASAVNMVPYSIRDYNDNFRGPAPSGAFDPNALGIYDLAGNVSEWISDYYSVELHREALIDPVGPDEGDYHVIRGSNYTHGRFSELRWTFRDYGAEPRPDVGFRLARYAQ